MTVVENNNNLKSSRNDFLIESIVKSIDNKSINEIEELVKNNDRNGACGKDIVFEMYEKNLLTIKRLKFIFGNCNRYLNVSSNLIKRLIKESKTNLLDVVLDNFKFFDNEFIIKLLVHYKTKNPISISSLNQQIEKYKFPVEENNSFREMCPNGNIYLVNACSKGQYELVRYLIENGTDINEAYEEDTGSMDGENDKTPLYKACERPKNEKIVKYLIKHGANVNKNTKYKETPLHAACQCGDKNIVKCLIENDADINKTNWCNCTPIFNACKYGHINIVKYLIELGADINFEDSMQQTPLFEACGNGYIDVVNYLVELGTNINKEDELGKTPLFYACKGGKYDVVKYLIEHGADINKVNKNGNTPLFKACKGDRKENKLIIKLLIEHGAIINKLNRWDETPLHIACKYGCINIVQYLVDHGADINKKNSWDKTPLDVAYENKYENIIEYLIEHREDNNDLTKLL